jgi:putative spermidine/putrescine transport system ATP-binding protein
VIEQAGPARDVFNAPNTEFVARFMGGHNVLTLAGARHALRADKTRLARGGEGLPVSVTAVEYQGAHVAVGLIAAPGSELTALVPEAEFFADPMAMGDSAVAHWAPADLHRLTQRQ